MTDPYDSHPDLDDDVAAFVAEARRFRAFAERSASLSLDARLPAAHRRFVALYAAAVALLSEREFPVDESEPEVPSERGGAPCADFGRADWYLAQDPYVEVTPAIGSLQDDVADVYQDVLEGLRLWDAGAPTRALFQWKIYFDVHWGDHAVRAIHALHWALDTDRDRVQAEGIRWAGTKGSS